MECGNRFREFCPGSLREVVLATAREYFEKAKGRYLSVHQDRTFTFGDNGDKAIATEAIALDFEGANKIAYLYVPEGRYAFSVIQEYLRSPGLLLSPLGDIDVNLGLKGSSETTHLSSLGFTGRVIAYTPESCPDDIRATLKSIAEAAGLTLSIRDADYTAARNMNEKPEAFISHDSRDKGLAGDLAIALLSSGRSIWYDEYSLIAGQSLRASIEKGLKECHRCIVVFSPSFFSNGGWSKAEFDSIFTREIVEQRRLIVPVWHGVTRKEVFDYSPRMADVFGLSSELPMEELVKRIGRAIDNSIND